ncbi:MAG TPA: tetratricopeptide repeat protein [Candidatus Obscuribacterales bacterium]
MSSKSNAKVICLAVLCAFLLQPLSCVPSVAGTGSSTPQAASGKPDLGVKLSLSDRGYLKITEVVPGSPADVASLNPNDEIIQVDGIAVKSQAEVENIVGKHNYGDYLKLKFMREYIDLEDAMTLRLSPFIPLTAQQLADLDKAKQEASHLFYAEEKYDEAIRAYGRVIRIRPSIDAYVVQGQAYTKIKDFTSAINDFNQALALGSTYGAYMNRGYAYAESGDYQKALQDFDFALTFQPENPQVPLCKGIVYLDMKQYKKALESFNRAIEMNPRTGKAYIWRANYYVATGRPKEALADFSKCLELGIGLGRERGELYFYRAKAYDMLGHKDLAEKDRAEAEKIGVPGRFDVF